MTQPSVKSAEVEEFLTATFGFDRREYIERNQCIPPPYGCSNPVEDFRDEQSRREYSISGMCQKCQDKVFPK